MTSLETIAVPKDPAPAVLPAFERVEDFLAWAEAQPKEAGSFELWDGKVIIKHGPAGSMNAERSGHARMKARLFVALYRALAASGLPGEALVDGPQVPLPGLGRNGEPDILVYLGPLVANDALVIPNPIIVCEVLSPSTAKHDMGAKLEGYFTLSSVQHYLICDPDQPLLIHHQRGAGADLRTRLYSQATDGPLALDPPGLTVDLTDVLAPPT